MATKTIKKPAKLKLSPLAEPPSEEQGATPPPALQPHGTHPGCRAMCSASGRWAAFHWHDQKTAIHWLDDAGVLQTWERGSFKQVALSPDGRRVAVSYGRKVLLVELATRRELAVWTSSEVHGITFTPSGLLAVLASTALVLVDVDDPDVVPVAMLPLVHPSGLVGFGGVLIACGDPTIVAGVHGNELRELAVMKKKLWDGHVKDDRVFVRKDHKTWFELGGAADAAAALDPARPAAAYRSAADPFLTLEPASDTDIAACEAFHGWTAPKDVKAALATSYVERVSLGSELVLGSDTKTKRVGWQASSGAPIVVVSAPLALRSIGAPRDGAIVLGEQTTIHVADVATGALRTLAWHPGAEDGEQGIVGVALASGGRVVVQTFERIVLLDDKGASELGSYRAHWGQGLVTLRGGRYAVASCQGRLEVFDLDGGKLRLVRSLVDASTKLTVSADDQRFLIEAWQWLELKGL